MIILTLKPGEKFEVPVGADLQIRFGSPFTEEEMEDATLSVIVSRKGQQPVEWQADAEGTLSVLVITPDVLAPGFYALKPKFIINGLVRKYLKAVGMRALADHEVD